MKKVHGCFVLLWSVLFACSPGETPDSKLRPDSTAQESAVQPLFRRLNAAESGIDFNNSISENERINLIDYFYLYNGGGVAISDVNNDGLADVFFTGNQVSSRLYLNQGNMHFKDVTTSAGVVTQGWCTGVTMVDINQDGLRDMYVCRAGNAEPAQRANLLFINRGMDAAGVPTFEEKAAAYGLNFSGYSTQSAFFDYDKDGDLDAYLLMSTNEIRAPNTITPIRQDGNGPANDRLYRNEGPVGNPKFTDVTKKAGILYDGLGLGVGISDLNGDGWEDIYVSNDFLANDHLYINNRNGTFTEKASEYLKHHSNFSMGNDLADFNNDGLVDIVEADMLPADNEQRKKMAGPMKYEQFEMGIKVGYHPQYMRNTLQLNNGPNGEGKVVFSEIGQLSGVHSTDWSWATLFADCDNDGFKDLLITNGYRRDITDLDFIVYNASLSSNPDHRQTDQIIKEKARQMPGLKKSNYAFRNRGDLTFEDQTVAWGMSVPSYSNGAAYGDLDNDGDLDVVVNNIDDPAFVYENRAAQTQPNHYLRIRLRGSSGNRDGLGADIRLYHGNRMQLYHQAVTRGYQSSVDYTIHTGLGTSQRVDSLKITWPDGNEQWQRNVATDQTLLLNYQDAMPAKRLVSRPVATLLEETSRHRQVNYVHQEDEYNDFAREILLPHKYSRLGPGIAVGDLNGDDRDDFFVGGPYHRSGELFVQTPQGTFRSSPLAGGDKYEEEMGSLLFDADNDGDLDLYVVSGGNEFAADSEYFQDKLYFNDGKGNFRWSPASLPTMRTSGSCVVAADYDQDGDLDLFVGGRLTPLQFPLPGTSYLLQNDKGTFKDVTDQVAPGLRNVGMVTAALWTDFDGDRRVDLLVTGEFMPIVLYRNEGNILTDVTTASGLATATGWWNSLNGADFDRDGDIDYVAGNLGLNSRYKASFGEPVSVYAGDFDGNGSLDPILTHYIQGREYPAASRDDLIGQMVSLRRKFTRYGEYAKAQLSDIIPSESLTGAYVARATTFESSYLENLGQGKFRLRALPLEAQMAPVFGTVCEDVDGDANPDLLLVGNSYATEVVAGQYDAAIGLLLKGDGKGHFTPVSHAQSGFFADGDGKGLATIRLVRNRMALLATQNGGALKIFERRKAQPELPPRLVKLQPSDAWAEITLTDGTEVRREFYYGSSYLSQSSRTWMLPAQASSVVIYDYQGKSRKL